MNHLIKTKNKNKNKKANKQKNKNKKKQQLLISFALLMLCSTYCKEYYASYDINLMQMVLFPATCIVSSPHCASAPAKTCSANQTTEKLPILRIIGPTKCEYLPQKNSKGPPQTKEKINYFEFSNHLRQKVT